MITRLEILGHRAIRHADVALDPFQVLVGPNASGKSTFLDSLALLGDLLQVGPQRAVFGDARFQIAQRAADPRDLTWMRTGERLELAVTLELPESVLEQLRSRHRFARYEVALGTGESLGIESETLYLCSEQRPRDEATLSLFPRHEALPDTILAPTRDGRSPNGWRRVVGKDADTGDDRFVAETSSSWSNAFRLGPERSALANLPEDETRFPAAIWVKRFLMEGVLRIQLDAEAMRMPAPVGSPVELQPDGANLAWVVHRLEQRDPQRLERWVRHVQTALDDIDTVRTAERESDRARYLEVVYRNGLVAPSWLLSDGTLRMLALTLLAYAQSEGPSVVLIEEPENGIHPRAIESVVQSLSSAWGTQVFCATHSPLVLSTVEIDNLLCFARDADGAVDIVRGPQHPQLSTWRATTRISDLFAMGVLG